MKDLKNATVHLKIALGSNMNVSSLTPLAITEIMEDYHQAQLKLSGKQTKRIEISLTERQLLAIIEVTDTVSAMRGVGSDFDDIGKEVRLIDRMLKNNGYKRLYK